MRILTSSWDDGYLDYARQPGECRVRVEVWWNLAPVEGLYFVRRPNLATALTYLREIGWRDLLRKARSRRGETQRNEKRLACGIGTVFESDAGSRYPPGARVVFVAPCHPLCVERAALPDCLLRPVTFRSLAQLDAAEPIRLLDGPAAESLLDQGSVIGGWSPFSGGPVPEDAVEALLAGVERELVRLIGAAPEAGQLLGVAESSPVRERVAVAKPGTAVAVSAVLFGYGNYAKTTILPNLDPRIELVKIHEVDPVQAGRIADAGLALDSSPSPRRDERFDVYLIAGFHHTHAEIAVAAVERGAAAVVEKPLATEIDQIDALQAALVSGTGRLFAGFQRRFWPFNEVARLDLGIEPGEAISYRCAVDEEPLPPRHWYRWPRSRGRIVANGCHWIDHFLFLNGYAEVRDLQASALSEPDIVTRLELDNGARFEMRLSDRATSRTGMRNTIELSAHDVTVRVDNDAEYRAEKRGRILRRLRRPRLEAYRAMYAAISRRIVDGDPGDSVWSTTHSARATLMLADELQTALALAGRR